MSTAGDLDRALEFGRWDLLFAKAVRSRCLFGFGGESFVFTAPGSRQNRPTQGSFCKGLGPFELVSSFNPKGVGNAKTNVVFDVLVSGKRL